MDKWNNIYKEIINEAEEEQQPPTPAEKVDALDNLLFKVVYALETALNGKDEGKEDEQAEGFLMALDGLAAGRLRSKFSSVIKKAERLDGTENDQSIAKSRSMLTTIFRTLNKAKKEKPEDASASNS